MKKASLIVLSITFIIASAGVFASDKDGASKQSDDVGISRRDAYGKLLTKRIPMVALLANPSSYDNKEIVVDGILHNTFEDDTLYLNQMMADALIKTNGIGLHYNTAKLTLLPRNIEQKAELGYFHNKLCAVLGTFKKSSSTLENVTVVWEDMQSPAQH